MYEYTHSLKQMYTVNIINKSFFCDSFWLQKKQSLQKKMQKFLIIAKTIHKTSNES